MDCREFMRWMIYDSIEPFGETRADIRMAIQTDAIARMFGAKTKPEDFLPKFKRRVKQTWRDVKKIMQLATAAQKAFQSPRQRMKRNDNR